MFFAASARIDFSGLRMVQHAMFVDAGTDVVGDLSSMGLVTGSGNQ